MGISFSYACLNLKKTIKINILASSILTLPIEKNIGTKCKTLKNCTISNHLSLCKINKFHELHH